MSLIVWHQNDKTYTASILTYTAILSEQGGHMFTAYLEDRNKSVLREWHGDPVDFEEAERWAIFCAVDLEQLGNTEEARRGMLQTLDLCQPLLSKSTHPSHLQRLENIKEWAVNQTHHEQEMAHVEKSPTEYLLNWSEQDSNHYQAITPHGKATIVEEKTAKSPYLINPASRYLAQIEHSSGAVYKSLEVFIDFVDAEHWVQKTLAELDDPRIAKYYLSNIHFTLNICRYILPSDVDSVHITRLEYLEMLLDEALL
jgi:hypothetical protein